MKKKAGKTRGNRQRQKVRDLAAEKARGVKGGMPTISDISISKHVDKSSPTLLQ